MDGMNYAPVFSGTAAKVVGPGEFRFSVIGLDHGHVFAMTNGLLEAGAEIVGVYDDDRKKAEAFTERYPGVRLMEREEILSDNSIQLVVSAIRPDRRAGLGMEVMERGKHYFCDKPGMLKRKELEEVLTDKQVIYHSIELYPLSENLVSSLNYGELVWPEQKDRFQELHQVPWNQEVALSDRFILHKIEGDSNQCAFPTDIDLIYMDAFAPEKQPEMWSQPFYDKLYAHAANGAVLVTYCAKGDVRRGMQAAGFQMERLPGPPGKRHILRGRK